MMQSPNIVQRNASGDIGRVCISLLFSHLMLNVSIAKTLYAAAKETNAELLIVILQESAATTYREVKRFGDVTHGIPTQCVVRISFVLNCVKADTYTAVVH